MNGYLGQAALRLAYGAVAALRKRGAAPFRIAVLLSLLAVAALPAKGARAEETVIAALGDSLTQGYGLPPEQGFVPQLEAWLAAQGHAVRVLNAGVSGDTTAGGSARIGWTLTPDVDALIVALGGNDMLRGIDPAVSRVNLDAILQTANDKDLPVLLIGMLAPDNFGPEYKRDFDRMYADLADRYDALLVPDFLGELRARQADDPRTFSTHMQGDGLHPNARGVAATVEAVGPSVVELLARVQP